MSEDRPVPIALEESPKSAQNMLNFYKESAWNLEIVHESCSQLRHIPSVLQTSLSFSIFNLHCLNWYYTWNAETLQGY